MQNREPLRLDSRANPRFKSLRQQVAQAGAKRTHTLLLGAKLIEAWAEAVDRGSAAARRLVPVQWLRLDGQGAHPLESRAPQGTWILGEGLMRDLADAGSPPDHALMVAVGPDPVAPLPPRVIGAWGIQDPGNLGAILRSAAAFGFREALLGPGCTDPFSPKALRGSMGAAFLMPLRRLAALPEDGAAWFALDGGDGALALAEADLSGPLRLLVGNEGHGWRDVALPPHVRRLAIPIQGVESLNAAVAAGIACFEVARRAALGSQA